MSSADSPASLLRLYVNQCDISLGLLMGVREDLENRRKDVPATAWAYIDKLLKINASTVARLKKDIAIVEAEILALETSAKVKVSRRRSRSQ